MPFCKIYESPQYGQILIQKGYNPESESHDVSITIEKYNLMIKTTVGARDEKTMESIYNLMDLSQAEETLNNIIP